jgi:hypothetical protein
MTLDQIVAGVNPDSTTEEKALTREYFIDLMKQQKVNGERRYSDTEILKKANEMTFST